MSKKIIALAVLLSLFLVLGGCTGTGGAKQVNSDQEATEAVEEVSADIDELTQELEDINEQLG